MSFLEQIRVIAAARTLKRDVKLKDGRSFEKGNPATVTFFGDKDNGHMMCEITVQDKTFKTAIAKLPATVSGFTQPSVAVMTKWNNEGYAKTPTGKKVEPDGYANDGSPSWLLALGLI